MKFNCKLLQEAVENASEGLQRQKDAMNEISNDIKAFESVLTNSNVQNGASMDCEGADETYQYSLIFDRRGQNRPLLYQQKMNNIVGVTKPLIEATFCVRKKLFPYLAKFIEKIAK